MAKRDRILNFFPAFYRATDQTTLLHKLVTDLALPLEEADTHLFRIQRSHRVTVAEHTEDLIKLAATLNLTSFHFEDIQADTSLTYNEKLQLMRSRIQRIARICLTGLGTPWAILEATATFLNATIVPEHRGDPLIKHIDAQYFSHKAAIAFTHRQEFLASLEPAILSDLEQNNLVCDNLRQAIIDRGISLSDDLSITASGEASMWLLNDLGKGRSYTIRQVAGKLNVYGSRREGLYLHENLFHRKKVEPAERWQLNSWTVQNKNMLPSPVRYVIRGVSDHTVMPSVFCADCAVGLIFNGIIPDGKTLVIDSVNGAVLDGHPVDDWITSFSGSLFDFGNGTGDTFVTEHGNMPAPFFGNLDELTASPIKEKLALPTMPIGSTEWFFKVAEGMYDGSDFDLCVFETLRAPVGVYDQSVPFNECVFDFPPGGIVGMGWDESIPCCFKLLLPPTPQGADRSAATSDTVNTPAVNQVSRVSAILPIFKAAGIRAVVDTAKDAWILGDSVMRDAAATEGDGVTVHATLLRNQHADRLVSIDPAT